MADDGELGRTQSDSEDGSNQSVRDGDKSEKSGRNGADEKSSDHEESPTNMTANRNGVEGKKANLMAAHGRRGSKGLRSPSVENQKTQTEGGEEPNEHNQKLIAQQLIKYKIKEDPNLRKNYSKVLCELRSKMKEPDIPVDQKMKKQDAQEVRQKDKTERRLAKDEKNKTKEGRTRRTKRTRSTDEKEEIKVFLDKRSKMKGEKDKTRTKDLDTIRGNLDPRVVPEYKKEDDKRQRDPSDDKKQKKDTLDEKVDERQKRRTRSYDAKEVKPAKPKQGLRTLEENNKIVAPTYGVQASNANVTTQPVSPVFNHRDEDEVNVSLRPKKPPPRARQSKKSTDKETVKDVPGQGGHKSFYGLFHSAFNRFLGNDERKEVKEEKEPEPLKSKESPGADIQKEPYGSKITEPNAEAMELYKKVPRHRVPLDIVIKKEFTLSFPPGKPREVAVYKTMQVVNLPEQQNGDIPMDDDVDQLDLGDWICFVNDIPIKDKSHYINVVVELEKHPFPMKVKYTVLRTARKKEITQDEARKMVSLGFDFDPGFKYFVGFLTLYPMSSLGINIKAYQGRVYISSTDNGFKSLGKRTFLVGDVIMSIDSVEVSTVKDARELIKKGLNSKERYCKVAFERPHDTKALNRVKLALLADKTVEQDPRLMDDVILICDIEKEFILRSNPQAGPPIYHPRPEREWSRGVSVHAEAKEMPIQCDSINPKLLQHAPPPPGPHAKRKKPRAPPRPNCG